MAFTAVLEKYTKRALMLAAGEHRFLFYDDNGDHELRDLPEGKTAWDCAKEICGERWEEEKQFWDGYGPDLCRMNDGAGGMCTVRCATLTELKKLRVSIDSFRDSEDWTKAAWEGLQKEQYTCDGFRVWRFFRNFGAGWRPWFILSTLLGDEPETMEDFIKSELYRVLPFDEYARYTSSCDTEWAVVYNDTFSDRRIEEDAE